MGVPNERVQGDHPAETSVQEGTSGWLKSLTVTAFDTRPSRSSFDTTADKAPARWPTIHLCSSRADDIMNGMIRLMRGSSPPCVRRRGFAVVVGRHHGFMASSSDKVVSRFFDSSERSTSPCENIKFISNIQEGDCGPLQLHSTALLSINTTITTIANDGRTNADFFFKPQSILRTQ